MATIKKRPQIPPTTINVFLGLNESTDGDTELKLGEASKQINWRVTDGGKLKKMEGYAPLFAPLGAGVIQGQWYGEVNGTLYHLFAHGGHIYKRVSATNTSIGTLTDAKTSFFFFQDKVYILNGHEYKSWDGTTFADVAGYRPKIYISTPPDGGGTAFEEINNLTGQKHQTFSPDGIKTAYQLAETGIDSVDFVKINGDAYTVDVNYKIDKVLGKVITMPYDRPLGDSTTQIDVTKTSGKTYRYTFDGTGTNPGFETNLVIGDIVYISTEHLNNRNNGVFKVTGVGTSYFEVTNSKGLVESNKTFGKGNIYERLILGSSTTRIDISNPSGLTFRYTFDGTGTNPNFGTKVLVNDYVFINGENFSEFNKGVFKVTAVAATYFEVINENGVAEVDKTLGIGGIYKSLTTGEPIGVIDTGTPDNLDIGWTKGSGDRTSILQNLFAKIYGGANDSRVFVYGGSKNRLYFSGLADGVPSAEYFPANNYIEVGSDEFTVTGTEKQYDKLLIFTDKGSYYASYYLITLPSGELVPSFPTSSISSSKGNIAPGQTRSILNNPVTIFEGIYQWILAQLGSDARNSLYMSKRVQPSMDAVDLTNSVTFVHEKNREYWLVVGSVAWIYNYGVDVWYKRDNIPASNFLEIDGELYFGTAGTIMKFDEALLTDNGTIITAAWEMNFYDFGAEYLNKYMNNIWISLKPELRSAVDVQTVTNNDGTSVKQTIYYNLSTFKHCNFKHFSFHTSYNPQPFYLEVQAMGFCYFKVILTNESDFYTATVLGINLPARLGGKVR